MRKNPVERLSADPCPFWLNASAVVSLKPVICNRNNKRQGTKKKRKKKEIQTFYIDVSSILFTYNENDLFSVRGRKADREKERKRNGLSAPLRKEV